MDKGKTDWLTVKEAAALLRIPLTRCYELIAAGELPGAVRIGECSLRVNRRQLEEGLLDQAKSWTQ